MAEPLHLQEAKNADYSKPACLYGSCILPCANSAGLESCNGDSIITSSKAKSNPSPSPAHVLFEASNAQSRAHCASFVHSDSFFEVAKAQCTADSSGSACPHAISADPTAQARADFDGYPDAPTKDPVAQARSDCAGSAYPHANFIHVQSSAAYEHSCEKSTHLHEKCAESTHLHEECADSTEACGNYEHSTSSCVGSADICDAKGDVTCTEASEGNIAKAHEGIRDTCAVLAYPCVEGSDNSLADFTRGACLSSIPQCCSSECSSAISLVTNAISESKSRSQKANMVTECLMTHWTDAKHRSYLNFMEANFVKILYRGKYCALDVCGQAPCYLGSCSPPSPSTLFENRRVNSFQHRNVSNASCQIEEENSRTSIDRDEGEEVDSPSTYKSHAEEPHKGNETIPRHHLCAPKSKTGPKKKLALTHGHNGDVVMGVLMQDVVPEFAHGTVRSASFPHIKKRGLQPDCEQELLTRHKREKAQQNIDRNKTIE